MEIFVLISQNSISKALSYCRTRRVQACQTYVWDMQKERRAKNCFEDLTTQLQEEVKLVPWHLNRLDFESFREPSEVLYSRHGLKSSTNEAVFAVAVLLLRQLAFILLWLVPY